MSNRNVIRERSATTYRNDRAGNPIRVDVRAGSRRATITGENGKRRHVPFIGRRGARYGFAVDNGKGMRVEQPRAISRLPRSYVNRVSQRPPTQKR